MKYFGNKRIALIFTAAVIVFLPLVARAEVVIKDKPQAITTSPSEVEVSWTIPSGAGGSSYRVYRNGDLAGGTTRTNFTDSGLASNTSYAYAIRVVDSVGRESAFSPFAIVKTQPGIPGDLVPPKAPTWQTAVAVSATSTQLSWNPAEDNVFVAGYKVFRNDILATTTEQTNFRDTDLTPSIAYSYRIVAFDLAGNNSVPSETRNVTTLNSTLVQDTAPPTEPINLVAKVVGPGQVDLSWQKSVDNVAVTAYRVYRDHVMLTTIPDAGYTDSSVEPNTAYSYSVVAYDGAGNTSIESAPASVITSAVSGAKPNPPKNLSVIYENRQVMIRWSDNSNNETSFVIERRKIGDLVWTKVSSVGANTASFSDTGVLAGTFEYRVSACISECAPSTISLPLQVGSAPDAAVSSASPATAPAAPAATEALTRILRKGMRGPDVMILQQVLVFEGLLEESAPSGYFGADTERAVIAFQNKYATEVLKPADLKEGNGIVGELTRKKLNSLMATVLKSQTTVPVVSSSVPATPPAPGAISTLPLVSKVFFTHTLSRGMQTPEVLALQVFLVSEGLMDTKAPNGNFGAATYRAVIAFQNKYAAEILKPADLKEGNGIVGELTRKKLNSLIQP